MLPIIFGSLLLRTLHRNFYVERNLFFITRTLLYFSFKTFEENSFWANLQYMNVGLHGNIISILTPALLLPLYTRLCASFRMYVYSICRMQFASERRSHWRSELLYHFLVSNFPILILLIPPKCVLRTRTHHLIMTINSGRLCINASTLRRCAH